MNRTRLYILALAFFLPVLAAASIARADCSNPTGVQKILTYNPAFHVYQYCDGTTWHSIGVAGGGAPANGLVGYWTLDESSSPAADSSGNGYSGTWTGSPTYTASGKINGALTFNGTTTHVDALNVNVDTTAGHSNTVAFWMYWDGTGSGLAPISFGSGGTVYQLWLTSGCFGFNTGNSDCRGISDTGITPNTWIHVAAIFYNGADSTNQLYINGVLQTLSGSSYTDTIDGSRFIMGASANLYDIIWSGKLDDVRIYNRALSAAEIASLYNPDPCAGSPSVGTVCTGGSVYAGLSTDGNMPMYTTPADAPGTYTWNNGTADSLATGMVICNGDGPTQGSFSGTGCNTGKSNTTLLAGLSNADSPYAAAVYCDGQTANGYSDWYLPANKELYVLYTNQTAIGGFNDTAVYWSSSESQQVDQADLGVFSTGGFGRSPKPDINSVRCVRTGALSATGCINPTGVEKAMIYNTTTHVYQYCNGSKWINMGGGVPAGGGAPYNIGDTAIEATNDSGNNDILLAQQATLSQTATINSISFYIVTAVGDLRLGIYDATGPSGQPGAKKAETNAFTPTTGWNTVNVITPVSLSAGTYWLAYLPQNASLTFLRNDQTSGTAWYYGFTYGTMPATFSTTPTGSTVNWSLYATFTPPAVSCTNPTDVEKKMIYNTTSNVPQFCNGTGWVTMQ